eukprot:gb/GECH01007219.1/.p1 GENE.gb/GECH01007219.1/~~gb/GECH01007219.1/.p1  ORF type:complete len:331 (+),score=43.82 gb/GECH01007219.1/:1-993(+)
MWGRTGEIMMDRPPTNHPQPQQQNYWEDNNEEGECHGLVSGKVVFREEDNNRLKATFYMVTSVAVFFCILVACVLFLLPNITGNWNNWKQATCMPHDCFCEKPRGDLMNQPVDTWSNYGFVVAGAAVIIVAAYNLDVRVEEMGDFWFYSLVYGLGSATLGCGSAFYHASLTFIGQFFDNLGMFFIISWAISIALVRLGLVKKLGFTIAYLGIVLLAAIVNWYLPVIRRYAFGAVVLAYIGLEAYTDIKLRPQINYSLFFSSLGCIAVGFLFWNLDQRKILCDPTSMFQGHAVWHLLDAACAFLLYLFFNSCSVKPGVKSNPNYDQLVNQA